MQRRLWIIVLLFLVLIPASANMFAFEELRKSDYKSLPIATTLSVAFGYFIGLAFSHPKTSETTEPELIESNPCTEIIPFEVESSPEEALGADFSEYEVNGTFEKSFSPLAAFSDGIILVNHRIEEKNYLIKF